MKKVYLFIIAAIIMAMPDMAKAQNDYRQAVREYLESNPQYPVIIEQISNSFAKHLKSFNQQILLDKKADGEQIADKYNKEQMVDDLYDLLIVPAFSDNISAEEIRQISTILNTAEGKVCLKKSEAMKQSLIKNLYGELMKQIVANGGKNIKQENFKIEPVQPYTGCTNEYKELAEKYFEINRNDVVKAFDLSYDGSSANFRGTKSLPQPKIVQSRYKKNGISAIPRSCALKPLILELSDSAEALVERLMK